MAYNNYNFNKVIKKQKGVALVELALVLPMMLILFFAFFAAVRLFATYNAMGNIARVGTLWASSKIPIISGDKNEDKNFVYLRCYKGETEGSFSKESNNTINITETSNCGDLAIKKMNEMAESYATKLQLSKIDYIIETEQETKGCFVTVTVSTNYFDSLFKENTLDFSMNAKFTPYALPISFTTKAYYGTTCD